MNRHRHRLQFFEFADHGAEVGKSGHALTIELTFPSNRLDDLTDDLRQPPQGMCFVKRDRIGRRRQEVAALIDQGLQMKLNGLPV